MIIKQKLQNKIKQLLIPNIINYKNIHIIIYILICIITSIIMIIIDNKLTFFDSLFTSISSITGGGLLLFNIGKNKLGIQIICYFLIFFWFNCIRFKLLYLYKINKNKISKENRKFRKISKKLYSRSNCTIISYK